MTISGTNVVEITKSLFNSKAIVRLIGNGWHPRHYSLEIINEDQKMELTNMNDIKQLKILIEEFIKQEDKNDKDNP